MSRHARLEALDAEMRVEHRLGCRCRACGFVNAPDDTWTICVPDGFRCAGCGLSVPEPECVVPVGVDPLGQLARHFEPLTWTEAAPL